MLLVYYGNLFDVKFLSYLDKHLIVPILGINWEYIEKRQRNRQI